MHTLDQIENMFAEMGLSSEQERGPFLKLGQMAQESPHQLRKVTFIIATANTVLEEEGEDGKLERNPQ
jgi:hypothetical protein